MCPATIPRNKFNAVSKKTYFRNLLAAFLFTVISTGISHAEIVEPTTYEECVSEKVKTSKTNLAFRVVKIMCGNQFPQSIRSPLPKLSRGKKVTVVCMGDQEESLVLVIDPRRKKLLINDTPGRITKITAGNFYGSAPFDGGVINVSVNAPTGRLKGTVINDGERKRLSDMDCTEEQIAHSPAPKEVIKTLLKPVYPQELEDRL